MSARKYAVEPARAPYFRTLTDEETGTRFDATDATLVDGARLLGWGRKERAMLGAPIYRQVSRGQYAGKVFFSRTQVERALRALNGEAGPVTVEEAVALAKRRERALKAKLSDLFCDPIAEEAS